MYEKDYFMRVIEAFSRMISIILGYREKGDMDSAYRHILEAYGSVLKVDPVELNSYTEEVCRKLYKALELLKRVEESSDTFSITRFDKIASLE